MENNEALSVDNSAQEEQLSEELQPSPAEEASPSEPQTEMPNNAEESPAIVEFLEKSGIDTNILKELLENDQDIPDSIKQKMDGIFGKGAFDFYRQGVGASKEAEKQKADALYNSVIESVGGEDHYNKLMAFAEENYSDEEIAAFNQVMDDGNASNIKLYVDGLRFRYQKEYGTAEKDQKSPNTIQASSGSHVMPTRESIMQKMRDPNYKTSPELQYEVDQMISRLSNAS